MCYDGTPNLAHRSRALLSDLAQKECALRPPDSLRVEVVVGGTGHVSHGMMETAAYHTVSLSMCVLNVLEGTEGICVGWTGDEMDKRSGLCMTASEKRLS